MFALPIRENTVLNHGGYVPMYLQTALLRVVNTANGTYYSSELSGVFPSTMALHQMPTYSVRCYPMFGAPMLLDNASSAARLSVRAGFESASGRILTMASFANRVAGQHYNAGDAVLYDPLQVGGNVGRLFITVDSLVLGADPNFDLTFCVNIGVLYER